MRAERFSRVTESKAVHRLYESLKIDPYCKPANVLREELNRKLSNEQKRANLKEILGSDDGSAVAKVLDIIFAAVYPNYIGRNLMRVTTVNKSPLKVPQTAKNKASKLGQYGEIPIGEEALSFTNITCDLWGLRPAISKSMMEDEEFDVMQMQLEGAAKAMAEAENLEIITKMEAISSPQTKTYATSQYATLLGGISNVEDDGYNPNVIAINPADKAKLLGDSTVASALAYGGQLINGMPSQISILGLKLFVCTDVTAGNYWIIDNAELGILALRRDITIDDFEDPQHDLAGAVLTSRFGVGMINKLASCKTATA